MMTPSLSTHVCLRPCVCHVCACSGRLLARQVIDGMDVLDAMEKVPVGKKDRPLSDIIIQSITIHANPIAEKG